MQAKHNSTRNNKFNKFIQNNNLIDLGYIGNSITWYNKRKTKTAIFDRLD